ncbi:hypothetical protein LTR67_004981 [Exophiala xenobiotica]
MPSEPFPPTSSSETDESPDDGPPDDEERQGAYPEREENAEESTSTDTANQSIGEDKPIDSPLYGRMSPLPPGKGVSVISEKMKQLGTSPDTGQMPADAIKRAMRLREHAVWDRDGNFMGDLGWELLRHRWFTKPVVVINDRILVRCKTMSGLTA